MRATVPVPRLELPPPFEALAQLHARKDRSVHLVTNRMEDRQEVLKLVHPEAGPGPQAEIIQEFLLLDRLRHPHWVRTYGFLFLQDGSCGYRMEALESGAPETPADPGWKPRDPEAVRQILGALAMLHAVGFAHLDLKPAQILRAVDGIRLADPGLAAPLGVKLAARGTWGYMAPEILHERPWDRRADFFSLGCLLARLWTGESPFDGRDLVDQIRRLSKRPSLRLRDRLADVPEGLDRFVESLLDPDPKHRPADAARVWETLHTLAGFRDHYLERRELPVPLDLPLFVPAGLEDAWRASLRGEGPERWRIEGPLGSGRRRLLLRMSAIAETCADAMATIHENELRVAFRSPSGKVRKELFCVVADAGAAEHVVTLGGIGPIGARAALEAYGLPQEADEEAWTPLLLRLRLEERRGREEARRASNRMRRAVAAAWSAQLGVDDRARLARTLAARTAAEALDAMDGDPLVDRGLVRRDPDSARLAPAIPPWEREALEVLAGTASLTAAHAELLAEGDPHPCAHAIHAVRSGSAEATRAALPPAIELLREAGDLSAAMDLLSEAEALLGADTPIEWWALHAELAVEHGDPARGLPLVEREEVPGEWRGLLQAVLLYRAGRRAEAIPIARRLSESNQERIRQRAATLLVRLLLREGLRDEADIAAELLWSLLQDDDTHSEAVLASTTLLDLYSLQGHTGGRTDQARSRCMQLMRSSGARERYLVAGSLGADAFRHGDFGAARTYLETALDCARAWGDVPELLRSQMNLAGIYFEDGRLAESEALNREVLASSGLMSHEVTVAARRNLATVLLSLGRWAEALSLSRQARQEYVELGIVEEADSAALVELAALLNLGFLEAADALILPLQQGAGIGQDPVGGMILHREQARAHRARADQGAARAAWDRSRSLAASVGADDELARTLLDEAAASIVWTELDRASHNLESVNSLLMSTVSLELRVVHEFVTAMLGTASAPDTAALKEARDHLREASRLAGSADMRPWTWRCQAAEAGLSKRLGELEATLVATGRARDSLRDLLEAIGAEILQESYIMLPDPQVFLAWCDKTDRDHDLHGNRSYLEVFLR